MRTPLFLSTLFAVSLLGGAALADKPQRTIDSLRAHGDMVDKSYRSAERPAMAQQASRASTTREVSTARTTRAKIDRSASRVNCSDSGADCSSMGGGASHAAMGETASGAGGRVARTPAFLDKVLGSDRTNFNDADMDEGMSTRAANRAWAHAGHAGAGARAASSLAQQSAVDRKENQASTNREACNEADACMASSKKSTKEWSYLAVKAGTWRGPDDKQAAHAGGAASKADPAPASAAASSAASSAAASSKAHEHQD